MTINALMQTDLCSLGINFMHQPYKHYDIKNLKINGCEPFLLIGIVRPEGDELSEAAQWFIEKAALRKGLICHNDLLWKTMSISSLVRQDKLWYPMGAPRSKRGAPFSL